MPLTTYTPQEALAALPGQLAQIEALSAELFPTLTIDPDPDGPAEPFHLVFANQESLDRVKAVLVAEMRRSQELLAAEIAAGIVSPHHSPAA